MVNIDAIVNVTTVGNAVVYSNKITGGNTVSVILILFFLVFLTYMLRTLSFEKAFTLTSFIVFFLSIFLKAAALVNFYLVILFGILFGVGIIMTYINEV